MVYFKENYYFYKVQGGGVQHFPVGSNFFLGGIIANTYGILQNL